MKSAVVMRKRLREFQHAADGLFVLLTYGALVRLAPASYFMSGK